VRARNAVMAYVNALNFQVERGARVTVRRHHDTRVSMKTVVPISIALLGIATARADDTSWILQPELTPTRLAADGALLTASDSVRWPDGPSVDISYWLGAGDFVYRCAALAAESATNVSCWRRELVVDAAADDGARHISTRRRPTPAITDSSQSLAIQPYVWWNGMPSLPAPPSQPPGPRPTPLP
jgi:hypothetical protein